MDSVELFEKYRREYFEVMHQIVGDIVTCDCETCTRNSREIRLNALGQALVDTLAKHLFTVCGVNVELGEETILGARRKLLKQIDTFFTEFGNEFESSRRQRL